MAKSWGGDVAARLAALDARLGALVIENDRLRAENLPLRDLPAERDGCSDESNKSTIRIDWSADGTATFSSDRDGYSRTRAADALGPRCQGREYLDEATVG